MRTKKPMIHKGLTKKIVSSSKDFSFGSRLPTSRRTDGGLRSLDNAKTKHLKSEALSFSSLTKLYIK